MKLDSSTFKSRNLSQISRRRHISNYSIAAKACARKKIISEDKPEENCSQNECERGNKAPPPPPREKRGY